MKKLAAICCSTLLFFTACNNAKDDNATTSGTTDSTTATSGESKEEANKQTALASVNSMLAGNVDEALKHATPDAVDYYDGSGPPVKSLDSIKAGMHMWLNAVKDYKAENMEAVADGNKVFVYADWSGSFKSDFMGMKTAGKSFKMKDVDVFTFNDQGKITEHKSIQSMACMQASLK